MTARDTQTNNTTLTLLLAVYVAIESYFLNMLFGSIVGGFWLSNVILHMLSVFTAYLIMDAVVRRINGSRRKKAVMAGIVLASTIVVAIATSLVILYLNKLQFQSTFN